MSVSDFYSLLELAWAYLRTQIYPISVKLAYLETSQESVKRRNIHP